MLPARRLQPQAATRQAPQQEGRLQETPLGSGLPPSAPTCWPAHLTAMHNPHYQIVLRAERHRIAPILRLRGLLKRAWRDHALRCVSILQLHSNEVPDMKISTALPSKYLKAADVDEMGGQLTYTIRKVMLEEIGQDRTEKPVAYFRQTQLGLVLNRTTPRACRPAWATRPTAGLASRSCSKPSRYRCAASWSTASGCGPRATSAPNAACQRSRRRRSPPAPARSRRRAAVLNGPHGAGMADPVVVDDRIRLQIYRATSWWAHGHYTGTRRWPWARS
jgi:hypothetical protein